MWDCSGPQNKEKKEWWPLSKAVDFKAKREVLSSKRWKTPMGTRCSEVRTAWEDAYKTPSLFSKGSWSFKSRKLFRINTFPYKSQFQFFTVLLRFPFSLSHGCKWRRGKWGKTYTSLCKTFHGNHSNVAVKAALWADRKPPHISKWEWKQVARKSVINSYWVKL